MFVLFSLTGAGPLTAGAPTVTFASPSNGAFSILSNVTVTGNATGSADSWAQTSAGDLNPGTREGVVVNSNGSIALDTATYDDFNDNSIDTSIWTERSTPNVRPVETGGVLRLSGTYSGSGYWESLCLMQTASTIGSTVSADLVSLSGSTGWWSGITLYDPATTDSVTIGQILDIKFGSSPVIYWAKLVNSVHTDGSLGAANAGLHNYRITYDAGTAMLYQDGVLLTSIVMSLGVCNAWVGASLWRSGCSITADWDNVKTGYNHTGRFTSAVFDTRADNPVASKVRWTTSTPAGTGVSVQMRSGSDPDMATASQWAAVTNGQTAGLPALGRYVQYRATLTSADGLHTPVLRDFTMDYQLPVERVEVSIDGQKSWLPASGKERWSIEVRLPDGNNDIWARVTDALGDIAVASIKVDVDTTPPAGGVVIEDNASFTADRVVTLSLHASDRYGVAYALVGERPDLGDAEWKPYVPTRAFTLSEGDGKKTVHARFKDRNGWESKTVNDSILLDTLPPTGTVAIDGGAVVTRNISVALALNATDPLGVSKMQVSNLADLSDAPWTDYHSIASWSLVPGNGDRNVYARFRDPAGHDSRVYNASIFLDTTAPGLGIKMNNGAAYTTTANITLNIQAVENHRVDSMQVAEGSNPFFSSMPWAPWRPTLSFQLSPAEGTKTVTARLADAAGNIGQPNSTSIILDYSPPATRISELPPVMPRAKFTVSWNGTDTASGVLWYDVQYSVDNGTWKDWQTRTNATSAQFTGEDLSTYSFRARAQDRAGNLEPFPDTASNAVRVQLPEPVVTVVEPVAGSTVHGKSEMRGTCRIMPDGRKVTEVSLRVDTGTWEIADGTLNWSYLLDTGKLKNGMHTLAVRTHDGERYSAQTCSTFRVNNPKPVSVGDQLGLYLILTIVVIIVAVAAVAVIAKRRRPAPAASPQATMAPQTVQYPPPDRYQQPPQPMAPQPILPQAAYYPVPQPVPAPWTPTVAPPAPPPESPQQVRLKKVLEALGGASASLPPELSPLTPEDLADLIVNGDEGETPGGELLVNVLDHWYYADADRPDLFMKLYR